MSVVPLESKLSGETNPSPTERGVRSTCALKTILARPRRRATTDSLIARSRFAIELFDAVVPELSVSRARRAETRHVRDGSKAWLKCPQNIQICRSGKDGC